MEDNCAHVIRGSFDEEVGDDGCCAAVDEDKDMLPVIGVVKMPAAAADEDN